MTYAAAKSRRSHSRSAKGVAALLAIALALVLAACSPTGQSSTGSSEPERTLSIGATLEPASMDPWHNTAASIPQVLLYNVYETLVKVDANGEIKPLLAQAWEVSPDRLTYTFHLNPAAKFASGAPVDAAAVVANIERLKGDTQLTATLKAQLAVVAGATATDDHQVQVTLTHPSIMWLYDMSSTLGMMLDPSYTGDLSTTSAGSGPYAVQSHVQGDSVVLAANSNYWGNPARFDEVTFRYFTDPNAENAAMLSGDLDIISNLQAPDALSQFADTSQYTTISGTTNGEVVLGLNHDTKALAKLQVRQALTMAINRQDLIDTAWAGQGTLIGSMTVPTDPWYEDLSGLYPYDPTKAKALLKEAGYDEGELSLRLRVPSVPYAVKSAQFVQSALRDIGVKVTVEELDFSRWLDEVFTKGDYDMTIVAHVEARDLGKFADPTYYWHYGDEKFASLYNAAIEAPSEDQAVSEMKTAARYLAEQCAAIWLFALPNLVITKATISGIPQNAITLSFDLTTITSR
ncbi:MAG: ABC transporter substrate-binding protein [Propionicimonas sp.]|uniref:ABC transporter substrate-binding protein n=1 Tax=Propionicimonas sp. TaxID=1955623 RepID=UPI003D119D76